MASECMPFMRHDDMTESLDIDVEGDYGDEGIVSPGKNGQLLRAGTKRSPEEREEMVMRKKLRNRESAQRARDRQKAKMRWLEEEMQRLKQKNDQLARENLVLRHMVQGNEQRQQIQPQQLNQPQLNGFNNPLQNLPKTATPQNLATQFNLQKQQELFHLQQVQQQAQLKLAQQQAQANAQQAMLLKKAAGSGSHDSDNSVPSVLSTGSGAIQQQVLVSPHINQRGDELLKAAAAKSQTAVLPNNMTNLAQQQYAAALAAVAQQAQVPQPTLTPNQLNSNALALLQNQQAAIAALAAKANQPQIVAPIQATQQPPVQQSTTTPAGATSAQTKTQHRPSSVGSNPSGCNTSDDDK